MNGAKLRRAAATVASLALLAGCAAGANPAAEATADAGFWSGLWHGLISPITLIVSLFNSDVNVYEVHNNGNWYNVGFVLGALVIFSGSGRSGVTAGRAARRSPRRRVAGKQ